MRTHDPTVMEMRIRVEFTETFTGKEIPLLIRYFQLEGMNWNRVRKHLKDYMLLFGRSGLARILAFEEEKEDEKRKAAAKPAV